MMDFETITGFDWDAGNERKSADRHDVSRLEAEQAFFNRPLIVKEDASHSASEARYHALGMTDGGRRLHIAFTLRFNDTRIRPISARDMSKKERKFYDQA